MTPTRRVHQFSDAMVKIQLLTVHATNCLEHSQIDVPVRGVRPTYIKGKLQDRLRKNTTKIATQLCREPHRACIPPDEVVVVVALEKAACNANQSWMCQYHAAVLRLQL